MKKIDNQKGEKPRQLKRNKAQLDKKVTKKRVEMFYAMLGLAGIATLPPVMTGENHGHSVMTANSGV